MRLIRLTEHWVHKVAHGLTYLILRGHLSFTSLIIMNDKKIIVIDNVSIIQLQIDEGMIKKKGFSLHL